MLEERVAEADTLSFASSARSYHGDHMPKDAAEDALRATLSQAEKMVKAAQYALDMYKLVHGREVDGGLNGGKRRGVTSR